MGPALGLAFESSITMNRAEGKSIPKTLLDASHHFVDDRTNTKPSSLLIVQDWPTNSEIKDIITVIKSLENRGILLKRTTKKVTNQTGISAAIFLDRY